MTLGITIRISVLNLLDDTSSDMTLLNHNNRGFEACIEEESECHGWNNPRSVMVISHAPKACNFEVSN
nr:hypothetical protein CFP56_48195 [Quercus suber]